TIASGNVWRGELKNKGKDGSYFWVDTTIVPFLNKKKKPTQYLAIRFDITERKKAEQRVIKSNERFEKVTEATNDTIWDWDIIQKTFYRSKAIEKSFRQEVSKLLTASDFWKDNIHPDDRKKTQNSVDDAIADPLCNRWEQEYRIINYQEEIIYAIDRSVIIRDEDGKAIRMVGAMTDISEQKQMDIKLRDVNQVLQQHTLELERSNEELEQFAFIASHDLQEPLRMVSSFMDLLKRKSGDQFDEKGHQYIHFATDGAKKMKQIILDLLDYSRAGKVIQEPITFDLNKTLEDYKILRRKIIEEKKVIILNDPLPLVTNYKVPLTQAIHSILDNAIKYSKEDVQPKIEICVKENDKDWIIEVKDNGIGIDKHFFEKIFIIFQRLHDKDKYEGTGIGLSIAKKNIESCNGKIWVESTVNKGSTFSFTINKIKS
ncbi:MAG: ATP-binding protein, partial [Flavobacteriales bacterium]